MIHNKKKKNILSKAGGSVASESVYVSQEMVDWFNAIRAARFHYLQVAFPGASDEEVKITLFNPTCWEHTGFMEHFEAAFLCFPFISCYLDDFHGLVFVVKQKSSFMLEYTNCGVLLCTF